MKNMHMVLGVGILLLLLVGGGIYFANRASTSPVMPADTQESAQKEPSQGEVSEKNTLAGLLASGKNVQCTFSSLGSDQKETKGTVMVRGQKMRGDFTIDSEEGPMMTSMIRDGDMAYMWGSAMQEGIKIRFSPEDLTTNANVSQYIDPNKETDYRCKQWNGSDSSFTPPPDVTFRDMSAIMENVQNNTNMMKNSQCAACDNLEADAQAMCKQQLNCN